MKITKIILASLIAIACIADAGTKENKTTNKKSDKQKNTAEDASKGLFESKPVNKLRCWRFGLTRTGANNTEGVPRKTGEKWRTKIGDNVLSSPVQYDDMIYVGSDDGFFALNAESGKVKWKIAVKGKNKKLQGVVSSACVADGLVFFVGTDGKLYCVDALTGKVKWKKEPKGSYGKTQAASPGVAYGLVFSQAGKKSVGFDIETGKEVWKGGYFGSYTQGFTTNGKEYIALAAAGDFVPVSDLNTGLKKYRIMLALSYCRATPSIVGNRVYGASVALIGTNPRFPAVAWGEIKEDGPQLLKFIEPHLPAKDRAASFASTTVWGGKVFLGCDSGYFYTYDADSLDVVDQFETDGPIRASASVSKQDGIVYFTSYDGKMYALDCKTGKRKWEHKLAAPTKENTEINSCPWVEDGVIYIGTTEGDIVAIH